MSTNILKKVTHTRSFTIIDNKILQNPKLSMKAKGMAAFLLSLPDDWVIRQTELKKHFTDGQRATCAAIKELKEAGYIKIEQFRKDNRIAGWRTYIRESLDIPWPLQDVRFVDVENIDLQNSTLQSTNNTKDQFIESTNNVFFDEIESCKTESNTDKEITVKENKLTTKKSRDAELEKIFDQLWKLYPLKKARQNALAAFKKQASTLHTDELKNLCIAIYEGLAAHVAEHNAKAELKSQNADIFVPNLPHLATWLNQKRWNDEHEKPQDVLLRAKKKSGIIDIDSVLDKVFGGK